MTGRVQYVADGRQTRFAFPFPMFRDSDMEAYVGSERQAADSFAVVVAGDDSMSRATGSASGRPDGCTVCFRDPPPAEAVLAAGAARALVGKAADPRRAFLVMKLVNIW